MKCNQMLQDQGSWLSGLQRFTYFGYFFTNYKKGLTARQRSKTTNKHATPVSQPNQEWRLFILMSPVHNYKSIPYHGLVSSTHFKVPAFTPSTARFRSPTSVTATQSKTARTRVESIVQTVRNK